MIAEQDALLLNEDEREKLRGTLLDVAVADLYAMPTDTLCRIAPAIHNVADRHRAEGKTQPPMLRLARHEPA